MLSSSVISSCACTSVPLCLTNRCSYYTNWKKKTIFHKSIAPTLSFSMTRSKVETEMEDQGQKRWQRQLSLKFSLSGCSHLSPPLSSNSKESVQEAAKCRGPLMSAEFLDVRSTWASWPGTRISTDQFFFVSFLSIFFCGEMRPCEAHSALKFVK